MLDIQWTRDRITWDVILWISAQVRSHWPFRLTIYNHPIRFFPFDIFFFFFGKLLGIRDQNMSQNIYLQTDAYCNGVHFAET